ncbi:MAG: serine/threonine-protein kinase [Nannocystaceae bacterium]
MFGALFGAASPSFQLGRYVIMGTLGRGGMGVVFKAFDPALDRRVALKVLHKELDEQHTTRLLREAQALAKLSHPNVVQVYEVGEVEGQTFVAMELVTGQTLREWMRREPRPSWRACVEVFVQLGTGLAAAHARGLVHRDFKPGNAILDEEGRARVLDFGLARQASEDFDDESSIVRARTDQHEAVPLDVSLTNTGAVLGTPAYMPPEQMMGREADARSDQFSLCVALYEALYGERPYEGSSMMALMMSMQHGGIRPVPKGSDVPARLRVVLQRGLAPEPEQRWPTMEELLAELRTVIAPRRGRWLALGGGIALGLGLLGAGLAYEADMGQRCTGAEAQLDGVWDDARREAVKAAILGTELSYAPETWERVEPLLDAYADAWADKHTEVCEATAVRGELSAEALDLRMACLGRRRTALRAAVDVLAEAEAETEVVDNAVELVASLPGVTRCDDLNHLEQQDQRVPPPEDPQVASEVEALREELATVEAKTKAGLYAEALARVEPMVQRAEVLDYPPLLAEAEVRWGAVLERSGRYEDAERILEQAHGRALRHGHDEVVLDAVEMLTSVVGVRLARSAEGRMLAQMSIALAEYAGDASELSSSLNNMGSVCFGQGEYEEARRYLERALDVREAALGVGRPEVANSMTNLGTVYFVQGRYEEARRYLERALKIQEEALGAGHPDVAANLNALGSVYYEQGEYEPAQRYLERALHVQEEALGAEHPDLAMSLINLGNVDYRQGNYDEAGALYGRALRIQAVSLGSGHPDLASSLNSLGNVYYSRGEYEEAEAHFERSLRIREVALGGEHPRLATCLNNLGNVCDSQGRYEDALGYYGRALEIEEKALGVDHPLVAFSLVGLANVALKMGKPVLAREHAERAVSIRDEGKVPPEELAEARLVLARALWDERSERSRAVLLAEQARDELAAIGAEGDAEEYLVEAEAWLATHRVQ